jgi:hypothetical protein
MQRPPIFTNVSPIFISGSASTEMISSARTALELAERPCDRLLLRFGCHPLKTYNDAVKECTKAAIASFARRAEAGE